MQLTKGGRLGVRTNDFQFLKEVAVAVLKKSHACLAPPHFQSHGEWMMHPRFTHLQSVAKL